MPPMGKLYVAAYFGIYLCTLTQNVAMLWCPQLFVSVRLTVITGAGHGTTCQKKKARKHDSMQSFIPPSSAQ